MTMVAHLKDLEHWLRDHALPLWAGLGIDPDTLAAWEALDLKGHPCRGMDRRLRVQARQAWCFAQLGETGLARQMFDLCMTQGFDPDTGYLVATFQPDMSIRTAPHDLYDLAFVLLAAAALLEAGIDVDADVTRLQGALAQLKAPRGWHETAARRQPRRQNPHMHLFEAATDLFAVTRDPYWEDIAAECLSLFEDVFVQPDGTVFEFFGEDWAPVPAAVQCMEPGHIAEWITLIHSYERVTQRPVVIDKTALFDRVLASCDRFGLLPNALGADHTDRRLWPQTELLRAHVVMSLLGDTRARPEQVLSVIWAQYFKDAPLGGWHDECCADGRLLSDTVPTSSFYHVLNMIHAYRLIA